MSGMKTSGTARLSMNLRTRSGGPAGIGPNRFRPRSRMALFLLGVMFAGFGGWWAETEYSVISTWPTADGMVVKAQVVLRRGSKQSNLYAPEITVQFEAEGRQYVSTDKSMASTSFRAWPEHVLNAYPVGSHRLIHYDPSDPARIRLTAGYNFSTFGAPGIFIVIGLLFFIWLLKSLQGEAAPTATVCPNCGAQVEFGRNTCQQCGAPLVTASDAPTG